MGARLKVWVDASDARFIAFWILTQSFVTPITEHSHGWLGARRSLRFFQFLINIMMCGFTMIERKFYERLAVVDGRVVVAVVVAENFFWMTCLRHSFLFFSKR